MRIFYYLGRDSDNKSGVAFKMWKIQRKGRSVTTWWGAVRIEKREVLPVGKLQSHSRAFPSVNNAIEYLEKKIREKQLKGYEKSTRWRDQI
jgi:predicted DNA-binding WGR domain protein